MIEMLVAMTILVVVLVLSFSLLFAMKTFARRQQLYVEPRQTARRGVDYLTYFIRNAGARVTSGNSGIVAWQNTVSQGNKSVGTMTQVSYDNVTGNETGNATVTDTVGGQPWLTTRFADIGTDIISMVLPAGDFSIPVKKYEGGQGGAAVTMFVNFSKGCNNDDLNLQLFKNECQCDCGTSINVYDDKGTVITAQLDPANNGGHCNGLESMCNQGQIKLIFNSGLSPYNPPGAFPQLDCPVCNIGSMQYASFRVKDKQLQQSSGLFQPGTPNSGFSPLLDGVEDMQIAYIFDDGTVWDDSPTHRLPAPSTVTGWGGVPLPPVAVGPPIVDDVHGVSHVRGLRISLVAVSPDPLPQIYSNRFFKPAVEDGIQGPNDNFYHHRLTATVMIRNQMLGD
jgi:hypothetical protein